MSRSEAARFGRFELDSRTGELRKDGIRLRLQGQPIEVLAILLEQPGELVTREQLRARLWDSDTFVDFEHGLNAAVNKLRVALNDSAEQPAYIETIPRRGYRFIGPIDQPEPLAIRTDAPAKPVTTRRVASPILAWLAGLVALALIVGWGAGMRWGRSLPPGPGDSGARVMLAVLPFENYSGDPDQDYFSDGLTEEMISELGQLDSPRLGVIARTSVMGYKQKPRTISQIRRDLAVEYVLEGSVRRAGDRVRISAQFIRASDETHLWARSYDRDVDDVLPLQTEIARAITAEIQPLLPRPVGTKQTAIKRIGAEAYEAVSKGRYLLERRTADAIRNAEQHFQRAIALEPTYALAYVGLADSHMLAITYADAPANAAMTQARSAVTKALALDEQLPAAHAWMGMIMTEYDWDWEGAERKFRRAIELNPSFAYAHKLYAEHLSYVGRFEEAIAEARLARQLDPLSVVANSLVGLILYRAQRYHEALEALKRALELDPNHPMAYLPQGLALSMLERHDEAISALEKGAAASGHSSEMIAQLAWANGRAGRTERARDLLRTLQARSKTQHVSPFFPALAHAGLGEWATAIDLLNAAYREREWFLCVLKTDPAFEPVRNDARFQDLVRRLNLPS